MWAYVYIVKNGERKEIISILTTSFEQNFSIQQCFTNLIKLNYKNMKLFLLSLKYKVMKQSCFINV